MRWPIVLLVGALLCRPGTGTENTTTVTLESASPDQVSVSPGVDPVLALRAQRHNLLLLFQRYGENNHSLSVEGFRKLFSNLMERRRESIHREHPEHGHHHHPHNHHHEGSASTEHTACEQRRKRRHVTSPATSAPERPATHISPPGAHVEVITGL